MAGSSGLKPMKELLENPAIYANAMKGWGKNYPKECNIKEEKKVKPPKIVIPGKRMWHDIPIYPEVNMVTLISSDNEKILADRKVMAQSEKMKKLFQETSRKDAEKAVPINKITSRILKIIIQYCDYHSDDVIPEGGPVESEDEPEEPPFVYLTNKEIWAMKTEKETPEKPPTPPKPEPIEEKPIELEKPGEKEPDEPKTEEELELERQEAEKLAEAERWAAHTKMIQKQMKKKLKINISNWDNNFLRYYTSDILKILKAAEELEIKKLIDASRKSIALWIKGKCDDEVRYNFDVIYKFELKERELLHKTFLPHRNWFRDSCR